MRIALFALCLLAGCAKPVIVDRPVEVKVPVSVSCVQGEKPKDVPALKSRIDAATWAKLTTDQREKHLAAQALDRKAHGDKLTVATAGCG